MKTGILLPKSNHQPLIHHDFLAGCKASLAHSETTTACVTDNLGFGIDVAAVREAAEKMLLQEDVDVLVMYADQESLLPVAEIAGAANKLIVLAHPGVGYMHCWELHPNLMANKLFIERMRQDLDRTITSFAFHGWTTGQLLTAIAAGKEAHRFNPKGVLSALENVQLESPAGTIHFDPATHHTLAPLWLAHADGNMNVTMNGEMTDILPDWTALQSEVKGLGVSNWFNTYPCA